MLFQMQTLQPEWISSAFPTHSNVSILFSLLFLFSARVRSVNAWCNTGWNTRMTQKAFLIIFPSFYSFEHLFHRRMMWIGVEVILSPLSFFFWQVDLINHMFCFLSSGQFQKWRATHTPWWQSHCMTHLAQRPLAMLLTKVLRIIF